MKTLGIIGGLGPMAMAYFVQLVTEYTDVKRDQDHIPIVLISIPDTPDRTKYILGESDENPLPRLVDAGLKLKKMGAEFIAIPCVTAHYFYKQLKEQIGIPVVSLPCELSAELNSNGIDKVGILATSGTIESGFIQRKLNNEGIETILPTQDEQKIVMKVIYEQIKAGKQPDVNAFLEIGNSLKKRGAQKLLLGCTELSLIKRDYRDRIGKDYLDVLEVLAIAAVRNCTKE